MGCGGREGALDEKRRRGRRSRVVLTPRRWRQVSGASFPGAMVARKPGHQGDHEVSRNTIAQEMPGVLGEPVVTTPRVTNIHAGLRVHRAPGVSCALLLFGARQLANLGRIASRECGSTSPRHRPRRRTIQYSAKPVFKSVSRGILD